MKPFKIGFLAVIAMLAMSFTVISYEDNSKKENLKATVQCNVTDAIEVTYFNASCSGSTTTINESDDCPGDLINGKFISNVLHPTTAFDCPDGDKFCCATTNTANCGGTLKTRIDQVFCKP